MRSAIVCFVTLLLLLQLPDTLQLDVKTCSNTYFITSRGKRLIGSAIERKSASSLTDCLKQCRANSVCRGINYLLDNDSPTCSLVDTSSTSNGTLQYVEDSAIIYSAELACHSSDDIKCSRQWAYELTPSTDIKTQEMVISTLAGHDRGSCLDECLRRSTACRAALFNGQTRECRVALIGPHTVHTVEEYFKDDAQWDLYESNCRDEQLDKRKCQYLKVKNAGFVDVFDAKLAPVFDIDQCQARCVTWADGTCRSYTFDSATQTCYISHSTSRVLGKNPLDIRQKHFTMADLDDCVDFNLKCQQDAMLIRGTAMKLFSGTIRAKQERSYFCDKAIKNAFDFETTIPYGECGTKKQSEPIPTYSNLMFVKDGSTELVTVRDKLLQVLCRLHDGEDISVSYRLDVLGNETVEDNTVRLITPEQPFTIKPKYRLSVLTRDLRKADVVTVGDTGYILITVDEEAQESGLDFELTDLVAQDKTGKTVQLLDGDGCPLSTDTVLNVEKDTDGGLRLKIKFEGFPDSAEVVYKGLVKPCLTQCWRKCGKKGDGAKSEPIIRARRSPSDYNPRQFFLAQDLYKIRSNSGVRLINGPTGQPQVIDLNRPVRLPELMNLLSISSNYSNDRATMDEYDSLDISARPVPSRLAICLTQNPSCLFTVLLAVLQCFLVFFCVCIMYFYVQQWRECARVRRLRRLNEEAAITSTVQYQFEPPPSNKGAVAEDRPT